MIYAGSSNPGLARKIAQAAKLKLGEVLISKFANGEKRVQVVGEIPEKVVIVESLSVPVDEMIVELALLADALKRGGARQIIAVIPWLGYCKQDKVFVQGEPLSIEVVARLIQAVQIDKVITMDLHNSQIKNYFEMEIVELSAREIIASYLARENKDGLVIAAPDEGAREMAEKIGKKLGVGVVYGEKERDLVSGEVRMLGLRGQVAGKRVMIIDDNLMTGSTILEMAELVKARGAREILVGVTHHMYLDQVEKKLEDSGLIEKIVTTDTVMPKQVGGKLEILSVAELFAREIEKS